MAEYFTQFLTLDGTPGGSAPIDGDYSSAEESWYAGPGVGGRWLVHELNLVIAHASITMLNFGVTLTNGLRFRIDRDGTVLEHLDCEAAINFPYEALQAGWEIVTYDSVGASNVMHLRYTFPEPVELIGDETDTVMALANDNTTGWAVATVSVKGQVLV